MAHRSLSLEDAASVLREKSGKTIVVRSVRDVSARWIVLQQCVESRVIDTVAVRSATAADSTQPERDLAVELWSLDASPSDNGPKIVSIEDPRTGAVRRCPDCAGQGVRPCRHCGGLASRTCGACGGRGNDGSGRSPRRCDACGGDGRVGCTACSIGTYPCDTCDKLGTTFTTQRARIAWSDREVRSIIDRSPELVVLDGITPERELEIEFDGDTIRPVAGGATDHFRASARSGEEIPAIIALANAHRAGPNERVVSQRARVERVPVWEIECEANVCVYLVGSKQQLVGAEALRLGPGPIVAAVALVLGVVAILAGSVLR